MRETPRDPSSDDRLIAELAAVLQQLLIAARIFERLASGIRGYGDERGGTVFDRAESALNRADARMEGRRPHRAAASARGPSAPSRST